MLTGQAKKDYQRAYMKDYMRKQRSVKTQLDVKTFVKTPVRPMKPIVIGGVRYMVPE